MTLRILAICTLLVGCGGKDSDTGTSTGTPGGGTSQCSAELPGEALPSALYSVWSSSASDVWAVGADDGTGPLVLHYDGAAWTRVQTGSTGDLWWVWGDSADSLWFSGEGGRVIHHTPSTGGFDETVVADPAVVLFGLWGSSATDIYTVGSATDGSGQGTVVHYDGASWAAQTIPTEAVAGQVFKIWGGSATDVWAVGSSALIMSSTGDGTWTKVDPPIYAGTTLFTIDGCGDTLVAVGGFGNAVVARSDDGGVTWYDDSPAPLDLAPGFNGVSVTCDGTILAVGNSGGIWMRNPGGWAPLCETPLTLFDYHGAEIDASGGLWAVGGNLTAQTEGVVAVSSASGVPDISL